MKVKILIALSFLSCISGLKAQNKMRIHLTNGNVVNYDISDVDSISWHNRDNDADDNSSHQYEFVDLGLSVKWATFNIGAAFPEDYGHFISWGETSTKKSYNKEDYVHYTSSHTTIDKDGFEVNYPEKWYDLGDEIFASSYDAAFVLWGKEWRMPTKEEFQELINYCTWEWKKKYGVDGFKVTGTNGNWIFVPASGRINYDSNVSSQTEELYYWTSSSEGTNQHRSYCLHATQNGYKEITIVPCYQGLSIRPVQNTQPSVGVRLPYKSLSLNDFSTCDLIDGRSAWVQNEYYCQATGYQAWYGSSKTNVEVKSYLISPALNTKSKSGKLRLSFDQTIRFADRVANWSKYHKIYISKNYSGNPIEFEDAAWTELNYIPEASEYTDWTLYNSGYIPIPEEYVNQDSIYVAFYFYAPASASTTWELENFLIEEGESINVIIPDTDEGTGLGTKEYPYNVKAAINFANSLSADANSDDVYIEGIICDDPSIDTGNYGNATFHISDDGTENNQLYVFRTFDFNGEKFTNANKIKKGDKVVIYGPIVNYRGNTPETVANKTYIVSINGTSEGGNENTDEPENTGKSEGLTIEGTTVTLSNIGATESGESISIDLSTLGFENAEDVTSITLNDGTIITFATGTNLNSPKYYTATKGIRVYANNAITINGKSKIAKVVIECDSYNGIDYVGNSTATVVSSGNDIIYTNTSENAGTQMRVQKISIYYAEQDL